METGIVPVLETRPFERLPKNVKPLHYEIILKPNLKTFVFDGKVQIKLQVNEPTSRIVLNALDLEIKSCILFLENGTELRPKIDLSRETETAILSFIQPIPRGTVHMTMKYKGESVDNDIEAERSYYAKTGFETPGARRYFPCWDEPAIKSVFELTLVTPIGEIALSNMPVVNESEDGYNKTVRFFPTPIMSSYLVGFIIGDFAYVEDSSTDGIIVRVYTPPAVKYKGLFALHVAKKVLPFYKDYFQMTYPLSKMDLVAIEDLQVRAMGKWGLISYRQSALLVDNEDTSATCKQLVTVVVAHELARQWFGNLITMEWWTHLWFYEGYITFVRNHCLEHLFPEYDTWTQFVLNIYTKALELDCLKSSHPVEISVGHPSEINEVFDDMSHNKGPSLIRMLHQYLGDNDFREGMNLCLTRHQNGSSSTEDIWATLEEVSNKPIKDMMLTWTKQTGFPLIWVAESKQSKNVRELTIVQQRFCVNADIGGDSSLWMVPLTFSTKSNPNEIVHSCLLKTKTDIVQVPAMSDDWIKINPGTVGFYRTYYTQNLLDEFIPAIQDKSLPLLDRLNIIGDLFTLVQSGQCETTQFLNMILAMKGEDDYSVWFNLGKYLFKLRVLITNTDYMDSFKKFGRDLFKPVSQRIGWDPKQNESYLDQLLRSLVIAKLGRYGDPDIIEEAKRRFADHVSKKCVIPPELRTSVYQAVIYVGDKSTLDTMIAMYKEETSQEEKERIYAALGAFKNSKMKSKVMAFAMSEDVSPQDKIFIIISLAMDRVGRELVWEFLKQNWTDLHNQFKGSCILAQLVKYTLENFATYEMADEIESFYASKGTSFLGRTISQAIESVRLNAAWLSRDRESIRQFLQKYKNSSDVINSMKVL